MEPGDLIALEDEIRDQMRRNPALRDMVQKWVDARTMGAQRQLSTPLLNERETDMLRGRIAELHLVTKMIQNWGEG